MRTPDLRFDNRAHVPQTFAKTCFGCFTFLFLFSMTPGFAAEPRFVPGELLIGYTSASDRDTAIKKLSGAKETLRVRGEKLEAMDVQPMADKSVKLRLTFPARVLNATRNNPSEEKAVLDDIAKQLKDSDKSVQYVHPNWIAEMQVTPPSQPDRPAPKTLDRSRQRTVAVHYHRAHKHIHFAKRTARHHHRLAKRKDWWANGHFWPFSFSQPCPTRGHAHAHTHRWQWGCERSAMR
jgi:hypothetical protein